METLISFIYGNQKNEQKKIHHHFFIHNSRIAFLGFYDYSSYSRKIGDTRFYLVETMAISKDGKPLVGLYYKPTSESGFIGEKTPGFPKKIYWNNKFLIAKNYDGNHPEITSYIIINLDSVDSSNGELNGVKRFTLKSDYYAFLHQINVSEQTMSQTDNNLAWWKHFIP